MKDVGRVGVTRVASCGVEEIEGGVMVFLCFEELEEAFRREVFGKIDHCRKENLED